MGAQGRLQLCLVKLIEEYKGQLFKISFRCGVAMVFVSVLCCQVFVLFLAGKQICKVRLHNAPGASVYGLARTLAHLVKMRMPPEESRIWLNTRLSVSAAK